MRIKREKQRYWLSSRVAVLMILWLMLPKAWASNNPNQLVLSAEFKHFIPQTACIMAPIAQHCQGDGATIYPWLTSDPFFYSPRENISVEQEEISYLLTEVIQSLPDNIPIALKKLLLEYAKYPMFYAISGLGGQTDYLVYHYEPNVAESRFTFWFRSFAGKTPEDTVYLLAANAFCGHLKAYFTRHPAAKRTADPFCFTDRLVKLATRENSVTDDARLNQAYWNSLRYTHSVMALSYWLRAYRRAADGTLYEVTHNVLPPLSVLVLPQETLTRYWQLGFHGVFMDISGIARAPVFRWVGQFSSYAPGLDTLHDDPNMISKARRHFGFVVWNGKTFDYQEKVACDLWRDSKGGCPDDPFVITDSQP